MITKQNFKTIQDVAHLVENEIYDVKIMKFPTISANFVFDENESVQWNRDKVSEMNSKNKAKTLETIELRKKMKIEMFEDLAIAVSLQYNFTNDQADLIVHKAWAEGHSAGIREVVFIIEDLVDFVTKFNK